MYPTDELMETKFEAESVRWVNENLDRVASNVEDVQKGFDAIASRLEPVMSPSPPMLAQDVEADRRPISPLATRLDNIAQRLADIAGRQASLLSRIEV